MQPAFPRCVREPTGSGRVVRRRHCPAVAPEPRLPAMKRLLAVPLWFYTGWTAGAFADFIGAWFGITIGPVLGPVLGTAAAALFVGDPRRIIWTRPARETSPARTQAQPA